MTIADLAFASVLLFSSILATFLVAQARADARRHLQFAAALYASLAIADLAAIAFRETMLVDADALIVMALAPAALVLAFVSAFEKPPARAIAIATLVPACASGIIAAMTGLVFVALSAMFACVCAMLVFAVRRWRASGKVPIHAIVSALAIPAGAAAAMTNGAEGETSLALFSAAAILGAALATARRLDLVVEEPALLPSNVITLIRRER